jgi:hypothetical protein
MESIKDEDRLGVQKVWNALVNEKTAVTHEFRFKTPWQDNNGNKGDTWVLMSVYPEVSGGKLKSVFGSITNISQTKVRLTNPTMGLPLGNQFPLAIRLPEDELIGDA